MDLIILRYNIRRFTTRWSVPANVSNHIANCTCPNGCKLHCPIYLRFNMFKMLTISCFNRSATAICLRYHKLYLRYNKLMYERFTNEIVHPATISKR